MAGSVGRGRCGQVEVGDGGQVDAGAGPHAAPVAYGGRRHGGVPGVRIQDEPDRREVVGEVAPQPGHGLREVVDAGRRVLQHGVEPGVEGALPAALDVEQETRHALVVLRLQDLLCGSHRRDAVAPDLSQQVLHEAVPASYLLPGGCHPTHLLHDGNIQCVCL
jgi:hypothetical protein